MLVIRPEQMDAFRSVARRGFEDEMVAHLAQFSPPLFEAVGEEQLRTAIRLGVGRAEGYGLTFRGPTRLYLELMLLFGSHFDTDPQYPWAAEILGEQESGSQMDRAERLYERVVDYRRKVAGPNDVHTFQALRNIAVLARQPLAFSMENLPAAMRQEVWRIYPEKAAYVGDAALEALIQKGIGGARRQRFATVRGTALVIVLMLAFGHGCGADPLYPWIARTLQDEKIVDAEARAKRLETKALTWLSHVLGNYDEEAKA